MVMAFSVSPGRKIRVASVSGVKSSLAMAEPSTVLLVMETDSVAKDAVIDAVNSM